MKNIKRIISFLIVLSLLLSLNVNAKNDIEINDFINYANELDADFSEWRKSEFKEYTLYNSNLEETGILYQHKDDTGYFIYDISEDTIVEFSAGLSPYGYQLDQFKVKKNINDKNIKKEFLIYEGATFYSYAVETTTGFEQFNDITYSEVYLGNVADYSWYLGCAPTSAANLIYFWDNNGYIDLIDGLTVNQVIAHLAVFMDTDYNNGGGTTVSNINPGIIDYIEYMGYNNFSASLKTYPSFSQCKYEIDQGRPALISIINEQTFPTSADPYDDHTVTLAGYEETYGNDYLIIHDTWATSTPKKVYFSFRSTCKYLHKITD